MRRAHGPAVPPGPRGLALTTARLPGVALPDKFPSRSAVKSLQEKLGLSTSTTSPCCFCC